MKNRQGNVCVCHWSTDKTSDSTPRGRMKKTLKEFSPWMQVMDSYGRKNKDAA